MSTATSVRRDTPGRATTTAERPTTQPRRGNAGHLTTRPKTDRKPGPPHVNVGDLEKMVSAVGGGALAVYGLTRGTLGGLCLAGLGGTLVCRGMTGHSDVYGALGVSTADEHGLMTSIPAGSGCRVDKTVTINRPADDLYLYWVNFENLPSFMTHLKSVKRIDGRRSHWVAKAPLGASVDWDAEVHTARPNELVSWRSLPGSEVDTAGSVHFTSVNGGRATQVRVVLKYDPPAGKVGAALARWLGEAPERQIAEDLNTFKRLMEAGEEQMTRGQPAVR